jgi:hypothetical protein
MFCILFISLIFASIINLIIDLKRLRYSLSSDLLFFWTLWYDDLLTHFILLIIRNRIYSDIFGRGYFNFLWLSKEYCIEKAEHIETNNNQYHYNLGPNKIIIPMRLNRRTVRE